MKNGVPLYRDSHHLSVAGAMALEENLRLGLLLTTQRENDPRLTSLPIAAALRASQ